MLSFLDRLSDENTGLILNSLKTLLSSEEIPWSACRRFSQKLVEDVIVWKDATSDKKIACILVVRTLTGLGLSQAKAYVEQFEQNLISSTSVKSFFNRPGVSYDADEISEWLKGQEERPGINILKLKTKLTLDLADKIWDSQYNTSD